MSETEHPHEGEDLFDDPEAVDLDADDEDIQEEFDEEEEQLPDDANRYRGG